MNERNLIPHFIQIDEMMELKMLIPETLDALELKALMVKADKLFKLSEVTIQANPDGRTLRSGGYNRIWTPQMLVRAVQLKEFSTYKKEHQIATKLNEEFNTDYFTAKRVWQKFSYLKKKKTYKEYKNEAEKKASGNKQKQPLTELRPTPVEISPKTNKPKKNFPKGQFEKKFSDEMKNTIKETYSIYKNSGKVTEVLNDEYGTEFTKKQVADKINYMKRQGVIPR